MLLRSLLGALALLALLALLGPAPEALREVDLGLVRYPERAEAVRVAHHVWDLERRGDRLRVDYAHGLQAGRALEVDHRALGHRLRFRWLDEDAFEYRVPPECSDDAWACIYGDVLARSEVDLAPLLDRLVRAARDESWSRVTAAHAALAFVQEIPYRIPDRHAFGVLPPALVASQYWGDCDSKALLLLALLDRLGLQRGLVRHRDDIVLIVAVFAFTRLIGLGIRVEWRALIAGTFAQHRSQSEQNENRKSHQEEVQRVKNLVHRNFRLPFLRP